MSVTSKQCFAICVRNDEFPVSLEKRKIYEVLPDTAAAKRQLLRVVDESGESYLYPQSFFIPITLSQEVALALALWTCMHDDLDLTPPQRTAFVSAQALQAPTGASYARSQSGSPAPRGSAAG